MESDEDFQITLKPLYFLSTILCVRKYTIHKNMVVKIGYREVTRSLCVNILLMCLMYRTFTEIQYIDGYAFMFYYLLIYGQHLTNFMVISCYSFGLSQTYVDLIKQLNEINKFEHDFETSKKLQRKLRTSCIILVFVYFTMIVPKLVLDPYWNWARATFLTLAMVIDVDMLFAIFVTEFLALKKTAWSHVATELGKAKRRNTETQQLNVESDVTADEITEIEEYDIIMGLNYETDNASENANVNAFFAVYSEIMNGSSLMRKAFQFMIFFHSATIFLQSIVNMGVLLLWIKHTTFDRHLEMDIVTSHSIGVVLWMGKALILQTMLGRASEALSASGRAAQTAACVLISQQLSRTTTRHAKNVIRHAGARSGQFCACGALAVDAALPLRLASLVAAYTVVLLQFALL